MKKLQRLINGWVAQESDPNNRRTLIQVFCMAHKLNLASRSALIPLKSHFNYGKDGCLAYFHSVEKLCSPRPRIELQELHTERWISSEHNTIKKFLMAWLAVAKTMDDVHMDKKIFRPALRNEAKISITICKTSRN